MADSLESRVAPVTTSCVTPSGKGPIDDLAPIGIVTGVREIDADIDKAHGRGSLHSAARGAPLL